MIQPAKTVTFSILRKVEKVGRNLSVKWDLRIADTIVHAPGCRHNCPRVCNQLELNHKCSSLSRITDVACYANELTVLNYELPFVFALLFHCIAREHNELLKGTFPENKQKNVPPLTWVKWQRSTNILWTHLGVQYVAYKAIAHLQLSCRVHYK